MVGDEEATANRLYFRWYDPRVLRDFLPFTIIRQQSELFDDVRGCIFEGPDLEIVHAEPPTELRADEPTLEGEA